MPERTGCLPLFSRKPNVSGTQTADMAGQGITSQLGGVSNQSMQAQPACTRKAIGRNFYLFKGPDLSFNRERKLMVHAHGGRPPGGEKDYVTVPENTNIHFFVKNNQILSASLGIDESFYKRPDKKAVEQYTEGTGIPNYKLLKVQGYHTPDPLVGKKPKNEYKKDEINYGYEDIERSISDKSSVVDWLTIRNRGDTVTLRDVLNALAQSNNHYEDIYVCCCRPHTGEPVRSSLAVRNGQKRIYRVTDNDDERDERPVQDRLEALMANAVF